MHTEYTEGLNNFDIVYYINLNHRKDRLENIVNELNKTNIDSKKINRIPGIYMKEFGILGCAKSHCLALEAFLKSSSNNKYCIIFEDDFQFTQNQLVVNELINKVFNEVKNFDVLMLSANILNGQSCEYNYLTKIIDAQTLSGYAVNRKFAAILLNNYRESITLLEKEGHKYHPYCFDIYMKHLQPCTKWYALNPRIGKQMVSYSDIENKVVSYDC
jgi:GR25 family glycosyltransferase involved in LPS biosynthesis